MEIMIISIVTSNAYKLAEIRSFFRGTFIRIRAHRLDLPEVQSTDQQHILEQKLDYAWKALRKPLIVDETAVYIERYFNFPGTMTKHVLAGVGLDGIFKLINEGEPAYFQTLIGFTDDGLPKVFKAVLKGRLTRKRPNEIHPQGQFSGIFIPHRQTTTLDKLPPSSVVSHRFMALEKLKNYVIAKRG
jgi:XTP/dITP diphosphohydrolase